MKAQLGKDKEKEGNSTKKRKPLVFNVFLHFHYTAKHHRAVKTLSGGIHTEVFLISWEQDFALVQERHSSKVISYFATKALSLFSKHPSLEKQSVSELRIEEKIHFVKV